MLNVNSKNSKVGSQHPGGVNCGTFDAAIQFLPNETETKELKSLRTAAGGEKVKW
jgi:hypothetical protein